jgi:hypothetical protein
MQLEHVPLATDVDRIGLLVQVAVALAAALGAYAFAKLGGWWPPHRPFR